MAADLTPEEEARILGNAVNPKTKASHESTWRTWERFLHDRELTCDLKTVGDAELCELLKRFALNIKKQNGDEYKELTLKVIFNTLAKLLQDKVWELQGRKISVFEDPNFKLARTARGAKRKELQNDPTKRRESAQPFSAEEARETTEIYSDDNPDGLNRKFFQFAAKILAWRGNEGANCRVEFFKFVESNKGKNTGRIEYNPVFSKKIPRW